MARKRQEQAHENHERWLVSYADFITLLFAFFVVMFASSQTDKARAQQVSDAVKDALEKGAIKPAIREILGGTVDDRGKGNAMMRGPGGTQKQKQKPIEPPVTVAELAPSMQYLTEQLKHEIKDGKIELKLEPRGLVVSLRQATFFPSGNDSIDPNTYNSLEKIGTIVRDLPNPFRLEGHTDSVPIHSGRFHSNWELSAARAIALLDYLTTHSEVPTGRLAVAGYADTVPADTNETEEGRAHNRRVDIVILNQAVITPSAPDGERPAAPAQHK